MENVDERLARIEEKVDGLHENVGYIRSMFDKLDDKYAGKATEKIVLGVIVGVIIAFISLL